MDRGQLAREWFDIAQDLRSEIGALKLDASMAAPDLPGHVAAGAARIAVLVERWDRILMGYVASADTARVSVKG
jgi:hypothetical protein